MFKWVYDSVCIGLRALQKGWGIDKEGLGRSLAAAEVTQKREEKEKEDNAEVTSKRKKEKKEKLKTFRRVRYH